MSQPIDPWAGIRQITARVAALNARRPWPDDMTLRQWLNSLDLDDLPPAEEPPPFRPKNWRRR
jgi:hypothetical protein